MIRKAPVLTASPLTAATAASKTKQGALLSAAIIVATIANAVVAITAVLAGANTSVTALTPAVYAAFTIVGILIGYAGWRLVRRVARAPERAMAIAVPVVLVLSWVPDLLVAPRQPGATTTSVLALLIMHVVTAAVAVPVYRLLAPLRGSVAQL